MLKRLFAFILSVTVLLCVCPMVMAADSDTVITLSQKSAVPGDSIAINVDISGNPGIMAMTFGIKYNPLAFTYEGYAAGYVKGPTINNDSKAGIVKFVSCESNNVAKDGIIVTIMLKVNDTAAPREHKITVVNINYDYYGSNLKGCFARYKAPGIIPTVNRGSITVGATCSNSPHLFGDWLVEVEPDCKTGGLESRECSRCGHTENRESEPLGHDYEDTWTIDREATADIAGQMSRHCKRCDSVTDVTLFTLPETEDENIDNTEGEKVDKDTVEKLEDFEKPQDTESENEETKNPIINDEGENTDNQQNAEEIVENQQEAAGESQKREPSLYEYLFGNETQKGVLTVIFESLSSDIKTAIRSLWIPILALIILAL